MRRTLYILFFLFFCNFLIASDLNVNAEALLNNHLYAIGDTDSFIKFNINQARTQSNESLAELGLRLVLLYDPLYLSDLNIGEAEVSKLLANSSDLPPSILDLARQIKSRHAYITGDLKSAISISKQRNLALNWQISGIYTSPENYRMDFPNYPTIGSTLKEGIDFNDLSTFNIQDYLSFPPWLILPENEALEKIKPWKWLDKNTGVVYLKTYFYLPTDTSLSINFSSDISLKIFLDTYFLSSLDRSNTELCKDHILNTSLESGWHELIFQCIPSGQSDLSSSGFSLNILSREEISWSYFLPENTTLSKRYLNYISPQPPSYLLSLKSQAENSSIYQALYSLASLEQGLYDTALTHSKISLSSNPTNPWIRSIYNLSLIKTPHLPLYDKNNKLLLSYEKLLNHHPDFIPALLGQAKLALSNNDFSQVSSLLAHAYKINPNSLQVVLSYSEWQSQEVSTDKISTIWENCLSKFPKSPIVLLKTASVYDSLSEVKKQSHILKNLIDLMPNTSNYFLEIELLTASGDEREALTRLREIDSNYSDDIIRKAEFLIRLQKFIDAENYLLQYLPLHPTNSKIWLIYGNLLYLEGKKSEALKVFHYSLLSDPSQHSLREMVATIHGQKEYYNYGNSPAVNFTNLPEVKPTSNIIRLLDKGVVNLYTDGSFIRFIHNIDLPVTKKDTAKLSTVKYEGELLLARTIFPDGYIFEPIINNNKEVFNLPILSLGTLRELEFLQKYQSQGNIYPPISSWYFQDTLSNRSILNSEYYVKVPKGLELKYLVKNPKSANVLFEKLEDEYFTIYKWSGSSEPAVNEPDAVHLSERLPLVKVSLPITWEDINLYVLNNLNNKLICTSELNDLVKSLSNDYGDDSTFSRNLAANIYRFVCDSIDNSSLDNLSASHILIDRKGSRRTLLLALLRAAGFSAHPASLRPHIDRSHNPTLELPSLEDFPIDLVRLSLPQGSVLWLDTRFDVLAFGEMPEDFSEASVVTFLPEGPLFEVIPRLSISSSANSEEKIFQLPSSFSPITVTGKRIIGGIPGLERKKFLSISNPESKKLSLLSDLHSIFSDAELISLDILTTGEHVSGLLEKYEITTTLPLSEGREGSLFVSLSLSTPAPISFESKNMLTRTTTCHIKRDYASLDKNVFLIPSGYRLLNLPKGLAMPSRFGTYQLRINVLDQNTVEVIRHYHFPAQRIPPSEWSDFIDYLTKIELAENQWLEYGKM